MCMTCGCFFGRERAGGFRLLSCLPHIVHSFTSTCLKYLGTDPSSHSEQGAKVIRVGLRIGITSLNLPDHDITCKFLWALAYAILLILPYTNARTCRVRLHNMLVAY